MGLHERISLEKAWNKGPGISDGEDVERAVLGSPKKKEENNEYVPFQEAIRQVKEDQPSPFERSLIVKELRNKIAANCTDKTEAVKFFTAVGTPLDIYHGIDAFFEQGLRRVTLDISMREKRSFKADVLMKVDMDRDGNIIVEPIELENVARDIAQRLTTQ